MKKNKKTIQVGDWVKIIKESKTTGLSGAQLKVISVDEGSVEVIVGKSKIKFQYDEVVPMTFKEKWGIDKLPTLYHGTDLRFVILPEEVRKRYIDICHMFIKALSGLYQPYLHQQGENKMELLSEEQKKQNPKLAENIREAMSNLMMMNYSEEWEYGDFYLTSNKISACMYAHKSFAGGELGFTAYHLLKGVELLGADLSNSKELKPMIDALKILAEGEPKPVIFSFDDLSPEYLQPAFGGSLQKYIKNGRIGVQEFRYTQSITLDLSKAELLDKDYEKAMVKIKEQY